jgi:RNA polymerase sigma factor (sigma-70 family)
MRARREISATELYGLISRLRPVALGYLNHPADADDVVHDTWIAVHEMLELHAVRRIAQVARTMLRLMCHLQNIDDERRAPWDGIPMIDLQTPEVECQEQERAHLLKQLALSIGPPRQREVFMRHFLDGESADEVCRHCGFTRQRFYQHNERGKKFLEKRAGMYGSLAERNNYGQS